MFLTVDLPYRGQRHADIKNGLTVPPRLTLRNCWDIATKPNWAMSVLMGKRKSFGNLDSYLGSQPGYAPSVLKTGSWATSNSDQSLNWRDLDWIRERWKGKLVLKGILDVEDAKNAAQEGVDGIVVSNHGGRQLDGASGSISVLPYIADAVGDRLEVLFDGGVRSGHDVFKALANGARGCLIGRAVSLRPRRDGRSRRRGGVGSDPRELRQRHDPDRHHRGQSDHARQTPPRAIEELASSWPGLSWPSTSWSLREELVPGTRPGMTRDRGVALFPERQSDQPEPADDHAPPGKQRKAVARDVAEECFHHDPAENE